MDIATKARIKHDLIQVHSQLMTSSAMVGQVLPAQGSSSTGPVHVHLQPAMQAHLAGLKMQADAIEKLRKTVEQMLDAS